MPSLLLERVTSNAIGRGLFNLARPTVEWASRKLNPELPPDRKWIKVKSNGRTFALEVRRRSTDYSMIRQCFTLNQYEIEIELGELGQRTRKFYEEILQSGRKPLIVDCGANIGASCCWFSARYPEAHILAVEPVASNFELLRKNTKGLDIDLRQAGIGAENSFASLSVQPEGIYCANYLKSHDGPGGVEVLSLQTLLSDKPASQFAPFLLKIDIEGGERALFSRDPAGYDRFPVIVMEPHDWMFPGELTSRDFFRFHVEAGREFMMSNENVVSIALERRASSAT